MHVYGLGSLESIFKSSIHPIFTSMYVVLNKRRVSEHCYTIFSPSWTVMFQNTANNLDVKTFVFLSFAVVCSTGEWLLSVPLMVPLDDTQTGS